MSSANAANVGARRRLGALPPVQGELAAITIAQLDYNILRLYGRIQPGGKKNI